MAAHQSQKKQVAIESLLNESENENNRNINPDLLQKIQTNIEVTKKRYWKRMENSSSPIESIEREVVCSFRLTLSEDDNDKEGFSLLSMST